MELFYTWLCLMLCVWNTYSANTTALLGIASQLGFEDPSWSNSSDPCRDKWTGVTCISDEVTELNLNDKNLSADISNLSFSGLPYLTYLDLGLNSLQGNLSHSLFSLTFLSTLNLGSNNLEGTIPSEVSSLINLKELELDSNRLSGSIPASIGELKNLTTLYLHTNLLTGAIPYEIGGLSNITTLYLYSNRLNGSLPSSIANLTSLTDLRVAGNNLSGNISFLEYAKSLQYIDLHKNGFKGNLPSFPLDALPSLAELNLGFNNFSGSIPASYGRGTLQYLFLSHNRLEGTIPESFGSLSKIQFLDISHNELTGSVEMLPNSSGVQVSYAFNYVNDSSPLLCKTQPNGPCFPSISGSQTSFSINVGSEAATEYNNTRFEADLKVSFTTGIQMKKYWALELGGRRGDVQTPEEAPASLSDLYKSYRWSSDYIAYHGINLMPGSYLITLYFMEPIFSSSGGRLFDIYVQGERKEQFFDVWSYAGGKNIPCQIYFDSTVENGTLSVELWGDATDKKISSSMQAAYRKEIAGPILFGISVTSTRRAKKGWKKTMMWSSMGGTVGLVLILSAAGLWLHYRRKIEKNPTVCVMPEELGGPSVYTFKELYEGTNGFDKTRKLGEGAYGGVYKGILRDGSTVAVKRLFEKACTTEEDFKREISILCMLQHRNLVGVRGYCLTSKHQLLVCDYVPNGSLDKHLFAKNAQDPVLSWDLRRQIAIGSASGLAYLHDESKVRVIHCDVKPGNILLDADFNPRICDFGLSSLFQDDKSHLTVTRLRGTAGYLSPEYAMHLHLSDKVDVYSFGVVLLELLTGRRPMDARLPSQQTFLTIWARDSAYANPSNVHALVDERLGKQFIEDEATDMAKVALLCIQDLPLFRPKMKDVYMMLNGSIPIPSLPHELVASWKKIRALEIHTDQESISISHGAHVR